MSNRDRDVALLLLLLFLLRWKPQEVVTAKPTFEGFPEE